MEILDKVHNPELVEAKMCRLRLRFFGHCMRKDSGSREGDNVRHNQRLKKKRSPEDTLHTGRLRHQPRRSCGLLMQKSGLMSPVHTTKTNPGSLQVSFNPRGAQLCPRLILIFCSLDIKMARIRVSKCYAMLRMRSYISCSPFLNLVLIKAFLLLNLFHYM